MWKSIHAADLNLSKKLAFCAESNLLRPLMILFELSGHGVPWLSFTVFAMFKAPTTAEKEVFLNLFLALVIDLIVIAVLKGTFRRSRPVYNQKDMLLTVSLDHYSFPSGHATRSALVMVFLLNHIQFRLGMRLFVVLWSFSVGFSRVVLGRHHLSDVLVGFAVGYLQYHYILLNVWMSWTYFDSTILSMLNY